MIPPKTNQPPKPMPTIAEILAARALANRAVHNSLTPRQVPTLLDTPASLSRLNLPITPATVDWLSQRAGTPHVALVGGQLVPLIKSSVIEALGVSIGKARDILPPA